MGRNHVSMNVTFRGMGIQRSKVLWLIKLETDLDKKRQNLRQNFRRRSFDFGPKSKKRLKRAQKSILAKGCMNAL